MAGCQSDGIVAIGNAVALGTDVTVDSGGLVYYVDSGQTIHQMWFTGTQWMDANLMASSQSGVTVQPGSDVTVDASGSVYYVSSFQTVRKMYWGGSQWLDADLTSSSQTSYRVESFTGITVDNSYNIYYVGTGLTVQKMWWGGSQFLNADLMASSQSGLHVQPGSQVTVDGSYNIYYVTTAQAIHQMSWGTNQYVDVSINAQLLVEPGTGVTEDTSGSVYYVDAGQTVHKMYISGGQWVDANLMASTQSGYFTAPGVGVAVDGSANVYYVDAGQTIHEMYWTGTQFVDANLMASSGSGMKVSVAFMITGQVTSGGAALNGVSVTLSGTTASGTSVSQTTTTATVNGSDGQYSFLVADGGSYTVAASDANSDIFSPASHTFANIGQNQTLNFGLASSTATLSGVLVPQPQPVSAPGIVPPPIVTASAANCNDISGGWTDSTGHNTYALSQVGTSVSGSATTTQTGCGQFSGTVQGNMTGIGAFTLNLTAPATDACGVPIESPQVTENVTLSGCSAAQVVVSSGSSGFAGSGGPGGTVSWTRSSAPPGVTLSVDLMGGTVSAILSGQNKLAPLAIQISGAGQTRTVASHASASAGNSFTDSLQRTSLAVGQYGSVLATWDTTSVTLPVGFYVIGNTRFSQYNNPYENQCAANPQAVWIVYKIDNSLCYYNQTTLGSKFVSQTNVNGFGVTQANQVIASYATGARTVCPAAPRGAPDGTNTFFAVDAGGAPINKITGARTPDGHNFYVLSDGTGLANPFLNNNPQPGSLARDPSSTILSPGDQVMMVDQGDSPNPDIRSVQDICPACATGFGSPKWPGTVAHIDSFSSSTSCNVADVPDYGNRLAIRLR